MKIKKFLLATCIVVCGASIMHSQSLLVSSGTSLAYTVQYPAVTGTLIPDGFMFTFKAHTSNTGAATMSVNGSSPYPIRKNGGVNIGAADIVAGRFYTVIYSAVTNVWQLLSVPENGTGISGTGSAGAIPFFTGPITQSADGANFFWDNTNKRLGIGTNTPDANFQINSGSSFAQLIINANLVNNAAIELRSTDGTTNEYIDFTSSSTSTAGNGTPDFDHRILSDGATFAILNSTGQRIVYENGNFGIGIFTSPSNKLDVNGGARIRSLSVPGVVFTNVLGELSVSSTTGASAWTISGGNIFSANTSANIAIGLNTATFPGIVGGATRYFTLSGSPAYSGSALPSLELFGSINTANQPVGRIDWVNNTTPFNSFSNYARIEGRSGGVTVGHGQLVFYTNNGSLTEKMRLSEAGRLGIGVVNPSINLAQLQISDLANTAGQIRLWAGTATGETGTDGLLISVSSSGTSFQNYENTPMQFGAGGSAVQMTLSPTGNLGLRTGVSTPANKLSVDGGVSVGYSYFGVTAPGNGMIVQGSIGIGTSTPSAASMLHVVGNGNGSTLNVQDNAITNGSLLYLASNATTGTASNSSRMIFIQRSGANTNTSHTAYGVFSQISNTGTTSTNVAGYFQASGATNNFAILVPPSGGNVGIGTIGPANLLAVAGAASVGASYATIAAPANGMIVEGNVGIGTSAPNVRLEVQNTLGNSAIVISSSNTQATAGNVIGRLSFASSNATSDEAYIVAVRDAASSGATDLPTRIAFFTTPDGTATPSERMRITNIGNVGIGTIGPANLLAVAGAASVGASYATIAAPVNGLIVQGNVGIGTTAPQSALHIDGPTDVVTVTTDWGFRMYHYNPSYTGNETRPYFFKGWSGTLDDFLYLGSTGNGSNNTQAALILSENTGILFGKGSNSGDALTTEHVRITTTGNVGIGTVAPGGLLELGLDQGRKPGTGTWTIVSDERTKNVISQYEKGLQEMLKLEPVVYKYKNTELKTFSSEVLQKENVGLLAQQVREVFPEAVSEDPNGMLTLNIHAILIAYINAIKELNALNQLNSQKLNDLTQIIDTLHSQTTLDILTLKQENEILRKNVDWLIEYLQINIQAKAR